MENDGDEGVGCEATIIDNIYNFTEGSDDDLPAADGPSLNTQVQALLGSKKCSIDGKNNEEVENIGNANSPLFTVPKANTGDAGVNCSPLQTFTKVSDLTNLYSSSALPGDETIVDLFASNPLNHPCNWGKLKFGNSGSSKIVVPLYYAGPNGSVINPAQMEPPLSILKIRLRTPCKPIAQRLDVNYKCVNTIEEVDQIDTSKPGCRHEDICRDADRYQLATNDENGDQTLVIWQISGECTGIAKGKTFTETCALLPDDFTYDEDRVDPNSEIYENLLNNGANKIAEITQDKLGKIAYYENPTNLSSNKNIIGFLTISDSARIQIEQGVFYTSITKPVLSLNMAVDSLKDDSSLAKQIPYLEYQIVTDVPISNITQQFQIEINYGGQSFLQNYYINQTKNIVDFALQD